MNTSTAPCAIPEHIARAMGPNPLETLPQTFGASALEAYRNTKSLRHTLTILPPSGLAELLPVVGYVHMSGLDTAAGPDQIAVSASALGYSLLSNVAHAVLHCLDRSAPEAFSGGTGLTLAKVTLAGELLEAGEIFMLVGCRQWLELLDMPGFQAAPKAEERYPWLKGTESRTWRGITYVYQTGLPRRGPVRLCFAYRTSALGLHEAPEIELAATPEPDKAAWRVDGILPARPVVLDATGIVPLACWEGE